MHPLYANDCFVRYDYDTWSIETDTETKFVLHNNYPEEEIRHIFTLENNRYKEWNDGIEFTPGQPTIEIFQDDFPN